MERLRQAVTLLLLISFPCCYALEPVNRERWQRWTVEHGLPSNHVLTVERSGSGPLWVGTDAALARFNGIAFRVAEPMLAVTVLARTPDGRLWAGTRENGLFVVEGLSLRREPGTEALEQASVTALLATADGALWIGTKSGLGRYLRGALTFWRVKDDLPDKRVLGLVTRDDHSVIVGTAKGSVVASPSGLSRAAASETPGVPRKEFVDHEGNRWLAGVAGLERLRRDAFGTLGRAEGLPTDDARSVAASVRGGFWLATGEGLVHTSTGEESGLPKVPVRTVAEGRDGTVFAGTEGAGLWQRRRGARWERVALPGGSGAEYILVIRPALDGSLWVGTAGGAMHLGGGAAVTFHGKAQGLASNGVHDLLATRGGRMWAATDSGLSVWDGTGWRTETAAGRRALFALGEDASGALWAGGNDGIHRWDGNTLRPFRIDDPACAGRVLSLLPAGTELWWTGDRGVCRGTPQDGVIRAVLAAPVSGVRTEMISQPAAVQGADGALWFATAAGVLRIPPTKQGPPAPVVIEAVRIEGRTIDKPPVVEMQPGEQNLEIEYAGLDLARPDSVRYRYRLAGLTEEWTDAGPRRLVTYSHLPRREYVFEVCTRGEDGTWGPPARLQLRLEPYFYQRGWFLALAVAVLLAAAFGLHRWRLRAAEQHMRAILDERTRIARDLHDTLAQSIGGISSQLEAARMLQGAAPERSLTHVDRARGMASAALEDMRTFVRDLRHSPAAEGPIDEVLRSIAQGADAEMRVEIAGRPRALRESLRTCLFRIAQEAVRNAQRHGSAGHIEVRLDYGESGVRLRVYDDGAGFDPSSATTETQFGLKGMQERAAHEGGTLAVTSHPGGGCTVELSAPYG